VWISSPDWQMLAAMSEPAKLVIIVGSVREGRFGPTVASWVAEQADTHGSFDVEVVDLAEVDIPLTLPAAPPKYAGDSYPRPVGMAALTTHLKLAEAFIIVTPEYNDSYPASLKAAIDWHFTQWTAKPVAFVSYGGAAGGRHAVLHLENVLTELHAVTIRDGLAFPNYFTN
jgi:NAD(P)H-dependent FMN reductase